MNFEVVNLKEKTVAGVTARTSNLSPDMGMIIGGLWKRFYEDGIYGQLPGQVDGQALGIYSDYEGDEKGEYSVTVACEVEKADSLPEGAIVKKIPEGKYAKFIVRGDMHKAVAKFWQELWQMDLDRAFTYDFEEYQDDSMEDAEIHMYISLAD